MDNTGTLTKFKLKEQFKKLFKNLAEVSDYDTANPDIS